MSAFKAFILTILFIAAFPAGCSLLNLSGFCFEQKRYIGEQELIDIVVQNFVYTNMKKDLNWKQKTVIKNGERIAVKEKRVPGDVIPYESIEEFYQVNPNCCSIKNHAIKHRHPISYRFSGSIRGYVWVKYKLQYLDENGVKQSQDIGKFSKQISNCGRQWNGY